jgi:putative effector of murein hydrolase
VFIGFFFSLFTTTFSVLGLRKLQGTAVDAPVEVAAKAAPAAGPAPKAFSDEMMDFMLKGTVLSGAISIAASTCKTDQPYKTPLQTIFMGFATFSSFIWGARMPAAVTKFLHPILTSTGMTFATAKLIGMATGSSFVDVLKEYKCGSLNVMTAGAGDLILFMLGPAVISFAIAMYSRKGVIASNLPTVTTGVAMGSAGGLFGTAAFVRALGIGGTDGCMVRLSTIPRNITTALAMVIAKLLGGDTSIAAVLCVLTGMFAAMVGAKTLDAWGVTDPVSRGLGLGAAGQSLGAASISHEQEAFPFAAVNMVLTAVFATVLASIPAVSDALIGLSCGSPEPVVSTAA